MSFTSPISPRPAVPFTSPNDGASTSKTPTREPGPSQPAPALGALSTLSEPRAKPQAPATDAGPPRSSTVIGVMGGMGPAASNQFGHLLIDLKTDAKKDQQHARVLLDQATDIPDRTGAILNNGASPVKNMEESLKRLDRGGADLVAITCNTAHHFFGDMQRAIDKFGLKLTLLHIVDATMKELEQQAPGAKKIGLLATTGTLDSKIYENRAAENGHNKEWVYPEPNTQANAVMSGIYDGVKTGNNEKGRELLLAAAQELKNKGVDAILLACTEIPLVLKTGDLKNAKGADLPLIDTLGSLAKEALAKAESTPSRLATPSGSFSVMQSGLSSFVQSVATALNGEPERPRRIGVMGGMGPAAAVQFSDYMVKYNTAATKDQQHVPMMVDQATDIPDRTAAILTGGQSPVEEMGKSLRRLAQAGADEIVMTCNTAHFFFPKMQEIIDREKLNVNVVHIVDATMKLLDQQAPDAKNIGLLATSGTVNTGVYQNRAQELTEQHGAKERTWMVPSQGAQQQAMDGIYKGVKAGDNEMGKDLLSKAAQELANNGADAILLACTEIPLVLKTGDIKNPEGKVIPLIDTLEAQAREAIDRARVPVPATPGILSEVAKLLCVPHDDAHREPALAAS